jgi:hypothetical protein
MSIHLIVCVSAAIWLGLVFTSPCQMGFFFLINEVRLCHYSFFCFSCPLIVTMRIDFRLASLAKIFQTGIYHGN